MHVLNVVKAETIQQKILGLIGKKNIFPLLIKTRFGIHTFGLKFPIDVLILNSNNRVVLLRENLNPNRIFFWNPFYNRVIELPQGTIQKQKIRVFDEINIVLV